MNRDGVSRHDASTPQPSVLKAAVKPVLLLIPGMLNTPDIWTDVLPWLPPDLDVRLAEVASQSGLAEMAKDAWSLLHDLHPDQPLVVCGYSMGAWVAYEMLQQRPGRVSGLVLLGASAQADTPELLQAREKAVATIERDFDKVVAGLSRYASHPRFHGQDAWMARTREQLRAIGPEAAARQHRLLMRRLDARPFVRGLRMPVQVVCGDADQVTPPELSRELAALIPGAELCWLPAVGHLSPYEAPQDVASALQALLLRVRLFDPAQAGPTDEAEVL